MASETRNYGTFADDATVGTQAWSSVGSAGVSDNVRASAGLSAGEVSHYLKCTNAGFALAAGVVILGIEDIIERRASATDKIKDNIIKLVKAGSPVGDNRADTSIYWPSSDTDKTYGGPADIGGVAWSPAEMNAATAGVVISAKNYDGASTRNAEIDYIRRRVTYTYGSTFTEAQALLDSLTKSMGKQLTDNVSVLDIVTILVQISDTANISISDSIVALLLLLQELTDIVTLDEQIALLQGKLLGEAFTLADSAILMAQLSRTEGMTFTEALSFISNIAKTEGLALVETFSRLITTTMQKETVTLSDIVAPYAFRLNQPLNSYKPRLLVKLMLTSGTKRFAGEDLYIDEPN